VFLDRQDPAGFAYGREQGRFVERLHGGDFEQDYRDAGCFEARGGTQGVGRATTQAVVASSVLILITDFFLTKLLISVFSYR
jgi:hypothetical protein